MKGIPFPDEPPPHLPRPKGPRIEEHCNVPQSRQPDKVSQPATLASRVPLLRRSSARVLRISRAILDQDRVAERLPVLIAACRFKCQLSLIRQTMIYCTHENHRATYDLLRGRGRRRFPRLRLHWWNSRCGALPDFGAGWRATDTRIKVEVLISSCPLSVVSQTNSDLRFGSFPEGMPSVAFPWLARRSERHRGRSLQVVRFTHDKFGRTYETPL